MDRLPIPEHVSEAERYANGLWVEYRALGEELLALRPRPWNHFTRLRKLEQLHKLHNMIYAATADYFELVREWLYPDRCKHAGAGQENSGGVQ